jgi:hypothetical protein
MKIICVSKECLEVKFDREELLIINAALNEICNGIELFEFETRIGTDREHVIALLKDVSGLLDASCSEED